MLSDDDKRTIVSAIEYVKQTVADYHERYYERFGGYSGGHTDYDKSYTEYVKDCCEYDTALVIKLQEMLDRE